MFVESTYEAIFAEIARLPREKATIRLNERVTTVKTTSRDTEGSQVVLKTEKGESLAFDEVLMTTPLAGSSETKILSSSLPYQKECQQELTRSQSGTLKRYFLSKISVFALFNK